MTITLPDDMRGRLERSARAAGFASVDEYAADVLDADSAMLPTPAAGARYAVQTHEELTAKLVEGINRAGDVAGTANYWQQFPKDATEAPG